VLVESLQLHIGTKDKQVVGQSEAAASSCSKVATHRLVLYHQTNHSSYTQVATYIMELGSVKVYRAAIVRHRNISYSWSA
jgi:hypothetical protein